MRIAFLCKRRYMSKDVILDRYARLYEIPYQLAKLGHTVRCFCLSYQATDNFAQTHEASPGELSWESRFIGRFIIPGVMGYPLLLLRKLREFKPDLLIGASDIPHVILGEWLARRLRVPFAADLYDNFEGFRQARIPGLVPLFRRAVQNADLVTTVSNPLKEYVLHHYRARGIALALPSTIDKQVFRPMSKAACRRALALPPDVRLIGLAGGLYREKGVNVLYKAWQIVAQQRRDIHLVLAGPIEPGFPFPSGERVHYLGLLPHARTAELFNALDVGVICIPDTPFGRYSFPQKAYEMLACGIPLAVTRIGAMPQLLADTASSLYDIDDPASLARVLLSQLEKPAISHAPINDWKTLIGALQPHLLQITGRY
jgi:glycosyltransferase involved in cell wall biosynthesis